MEVIGQLHAGVSSRPRKEISGTCLIESGWISELVVTEQQIFSPTRSQMFDQVMYWKTSQTKF
jgi:hypothetical protein